MFAAVLIGLPLPLGALVNAAAVLAGGGLGLLLHRSLPDKYRRSAFVAVGLCTLLIGMQMALQAVNLLPVIFSMIIGGLLGEWWDLHSRLEQLSEALRRRLGSLASFEPARQATATEDLNSSPLDPDQQDGVNPESAAALPGSPAGRFSEGLITAFLVFCVGSMTIVGSFKEGISGDASLIYAKSLLDGFTSIALASTYGVGVIFSIIPLLIVQAGLTWLGYGVGGAVADSVVSQLTAVGGLLILALGLNLLEIKVIRVSNLLPALLVIVLLEYLLAWLGH